MWIIPYSYKFDLEEVKIMGRKIGKKNKVSSGTFVAYATNASCLCYCGTTCSNCNSNTATASGTSIYNYVTTNNNSNGWF